jgi:hypothetical protein
MIRRSTWILLVLFMVLAGFAWIFQRYQASKEENRATATTTIALPEIYQLNGVQVDSVGILDSSGKSVEFKHDAKGIQWIVTDMPIEQVDSPTIGSKLAQLFTLVARDTLNQAPPLDAIGLTLPEYTINMVTADGRTIVTYVGSVTPVGNGYYVRVDSHPVVIVDKLVMDGILDLFFNPPLKATPTAGFVTPEISLPTNSEIKTTSTP